MRLDGGKRPHLHVGQDRLVAVAREGGSCWSISDGCGSQKRGDRLHLSRRAPAGPASYGGVSLISYTRYEAWLDAVSGLSLGPSPRAPFVFSLRRDVLAYGFTTNEVLD